MAGSVDPTEGYEEIAFSEVTARWVIRWSWLRATSLSILALVLWVPGFYAEQAAGLWILLSGPACALAVATLIDRRTQWHPNAKYWLVIGPLFTHVFWVLLLTWPIDSALTDLGFKVHPLQVGSSLTAGVLAFAFAWAERSRIPLGVLGAVAAAIMLPTALGKPVTRTFALLAVPSVFAAILYTIALLNHLHISRRIRRPGRCVRCQYLAIVLPKCPECGGRIAPLDGPVTHDARID